MEYSFRKAKSEDLPAIWEIIQKAILRRKEDGSKQWQDGYPNTTVIQSDINQEYGFVMTQNDVVIGYFAVMINNEPAYAAIDGTWLSNDDFVVFHRVALSEDHLGKGLSGKMLQFIEDYARSQNIFSVKADTNFDNPAMQKIFLKSGYTYCGEVQFRGSPRMAYEKILSH